MEQKRKYTLSNKERKVVDGDLRNKERTKQKWIDAVGAVLREKGYAGLSAKNIVEKAAMDRRLIALYFGDVDNLIDEYLNSVDYWMSRVAPKFNIIIEQSDTFGKDEITAILHTLFDEVNTSDELLKILNWEVGEYHIRLRELADNREKMSKPMFKMTDDDFKDTSINLRAITALLISGIYYLTMHAKVNGSTFCEIDINKPKGKKAIKEALAKVIDLAYAEAQKN